MCQWSTSGNGVIPQNSTNIILQNTIWMVLLPILHNIKIKNFPVISNPKLLEYLQWIYETITSCLLLKWGWTRKVQELFKWSTVSSAEWQRWHLEETGRNIWLFIMLVVNAYSWAAIRNPCFANGDQLKAIPDDKTGHEGPSLSNPLHMHHYRINYRSRRVIKPPSLLNRNQLK